MGRVLKVTLGLASVVGVPLILTACGSAAGAKREAPASIPLTSDFRARTAKECGGDTALTRCRAWAARVGDLVRQCRAGVAPYPPDCVNVDQWLNIANEHVASLEATSGTSPAAAPPSSPTQSAPPSPVVEMFKGQAALCAKAAPHSTSWDMQSCDDLERIKRGEKPANDLDDWFAHQKARDVETWLGLQTTNKSFAAALVPIGHKTVFAQLKSPSTAKAANESLVLQCPDTDTFITMHTVDAQNGFGATVRDTFCVGISQKDKAGAMIDCGPLLNIRMNLANNQTESLPTNVRLACELPAKLLHMR